MSEVKFMYTFSMCCGEATRNILVSQSPEKATKVVLELQKEIRLEANDESDDYARIFNTHISDIRWNTWTSTPDFDEIMITRSLFFYVKENEASDENYLKGQLVPNVVHCYGENDNEEYVSSIMRL